MNLVKYYIKKQVEIFNETENTIEIIERDKKKIYGVKDGKITLLNTIKGEVNMQIVYSYNFPENEV